MLGRLSPMVQPAKGSLPSQGGFEKQKTRAVNAFAYGLYPGEHIEHKPTVHPQGLKNIIRKATPDHEEDSCRFL